MEYEIIPKDGSAPQEADFALVITGDELEPYLKRGETAYIERTSRLRDGEVGVFVYKGAPLCRQFCEDSLGNVYLFTLNRRRKKGDVTVPRGEKGDLFCFGRVLMEDVPLPSD